MMPAPGVLAGGGPPDRRRRSLF